MILLDSSVIIELFRKKDKKKTMFYDLSQSHPDICISAITFYEIGIGNRNAHVEFWSAFTENLSVLPFDKACSLFAVEIYSDLLGYCRCPSYPDSNIKQEAFQSDKWLGNIEIIFQELSNRNL